MRLDSTRIFKTTLEVGSNYLFTNIEVTGNVYLLPVAVDTSNGKSATSLRDMRLEIFALATSFYATRFSSWDDSKNVIMVLSILEYTILEIRVY